MKTEHTFDGRPCPPEFKERLERLRKAGILDDPKFKASFISAAERMKLQEQQDRAKN